MPYFSPTDLKATAARAADTSTTLLTESIARGHIKEASTRGRAPEIDFDAAPTVHFDIFLSHSSLDATLVLGLYQTLTIRGYAVYLDQICDPHLSKSSVTRDTARILRYRMAQCRSLFVCTTESTHKSQWVPWELGYQDGWNNKAAILPITEEATFPRQEYFEVYPEVKDSSTIRKKPLDLSIWDQGKLLGLWGNWVNDGRRW